jgi:hypothetical protein
MKNLAPARYRLAKELTLKARGLNSPWGPQANDRVNIRGELLSKIYWKGRQWAVTPALPVKALFVALRESDW